MKKRCYSLMLLLWVGYSLMAQVTNMPSDLSENIADQVFDQSKLASIVTFDKRYENMKGSPLLFDIFQEGTLLTNDSQAYSKGAAFNFNALDNELVLMSATDGKMTSPFKSVVHSFTINNQGQVLTFEKFRLPAETDVFCQVLFNGKQCKLIKHVSKYLRKADFVEKGIYSTGKHYDEIVTKDSYYLSINNGPFNLIKLSKKDILERIAKKYHKKLEQEKGKILGRKMNEAEMTEILKYIDTL